MAGEQATVQRLMVNRAIGHSTKSLFAIAAFIVLWAISAFGVSVFIGAEPSRGANAGYVFAGFLVALILVTLPTLGEGGGGGIGGR